MLNLFTQHTTQTLTNSSKQTRTQQPNPNTATLLLCNAPPNNMLNYRNSWPQSPPKQCQRTAMVYPIQFKKNFPLSFHPSTFFHPETNHPNSEPVNSTHEHRVPSITFPPARNLPSKFLINKFYTRHIATLPLSSELVPSPIHSRPLSSKTRPSIVHL